MIFLPHPLIFISSSPGCSFLEPLRAAPAVGEGLGWKFVFHVPLQPGFSFVVAELCACCSG